VFVISSSLFKYPLLVRISNLNSIILPVIFLEIQNYTTMLFIIYTGLYFTPVMGLKWDESYTMKRLIRRWVTKLLEAIGSIGKF